MRSVLAIDPGPVESAFVVFDPDRFELVNFGKYENHELKAKLPQLGLYPFSDLAIEYPQPRGQPMYTQLVDTIFWIGRFVEASGAQWTLIDRKDVKMHLCGNTKAKDSNIRAALLSRFHGHVNAGGGEIPQVGTKVNPGPLYGVSGDIWAALAIAITYAELVSKQHLDNLLA